MFIEVMMVEVVGPALTGYFRPASTPEVRKWKAWAWLLAAIAIALSAAIVRLENPFLFGLASAALFFAVIASFVASASASVIHARRKKP